jgi:Zn-dependent protease
MRDTVRLGRIIGVPIGLNWSLMVIIGVFAFGLAQNRFPADAPGYGHEVYILAGALTAIALLAAVLLHELGHAVVARRSGLEVEGITLSWMGGVTRIVGDTATPGREFGVAAIGPLVSFTIGVLLWGVRALAQGAGVGRLTVSALGWLALINVVLAVFNLLPASPLDGGRILHAAIWTVTRDRWRAARAASWAGIVLATLTITLGAYDFVARRDGIDGVLLAVLGWWILAAARSEDRQAIVRRALDGVLVHHVMHPVSAAPGWITTSELASRFVNAHPDTVWLLERWGGDGYSGVVSGDAIRHLPHPWDGLRVDSVAVPVEAAAAATPYEEVLTALERTQGLQVLLVVEGERTVGAVLPADIEQLVRSGGRPKLSPPVAAGVQ